MADEIIETLGKGALNYGQVLMMQSNRIGQMASKPLSLIDADQDAFRNSVRVFDSMLKPYYDEEFIKAKEKIKLLSDPPDVISTLEEWYLLHGELNCLMYRSGLMPMEDAPIYDVGQDEPGD